MEPCIDRHGCSVRPVLANSHRNPTSLSSNQIALGHSVSLLVDHTRVYAQLHQTALTGANPNPGFNREDKASDWTSIVTHGSTCRKDSTYHRALTRFEGSVWWPDGASHTSLWRARVLARTSLLPCCFMLYCLLLQSVSLSLFTFSQTLSALANQHNLYLIICTRCLRAHRSFITSLSPTRILKPSVVLADSHYSFMEPSKSLLDDLNLSVYWDLPRLNSTKFTSFTSNSWYCCYSAFLCRKLPYAEAIGSSDSSLLALLLWKPLSSLECINAIRIMQKCTTSSAYESGSGNKTITTIGLQARLAYRTQTSRPSKIVKKVNIQGCRLNWIGGVLLGLVLVVSCLGVPSMFLLQLRPN